jgi:hypothetical protein
LPPQWVKIRYYYRKGKKLIKKVKGQKRTIQYDNTPALPLLPSNSESEDEQSSWAWNVSSLPFVSEPCHPRGGTTFYAW